MTSVSPPLRKNGVTPIVIPSKEGIQINYIKNKLYKLYKKGKNL